MDEKYLAVIRQYTLAIQNQDWPRALRLCVRLQQHTNPGVPPNIARARAVLRTTAADLFGLDAPV